MAFCFELLPEETRGLGPVFSFCDLPSASSDSAEGKSSETSERRAASSMWSGIVNLLGRFLGFHATLPPKDDRMASAISSELFPKLKISFVLREPDEQLLHYFFSELHP